MKSVLGIAVAAACGAFVVGGVAFAQDADCNVNGIPDAAEIAAGLVEDCKRVVVPDSRNCASWGLMQRQGAAEANARAWPLAMTRSTIHRAQWVSRRPEPTRCCFDSIALGMRFTDHASKPSNFNHPSRRPCPKRSH